MSESVFRGWPATALEFYDGLEADNSKAYWLDHKDVYDRVVKPPMEVLLAELRGEFGEARLLRPYRDTRFSADKSPYKTAIAAMIGDGYIQLSAGGLMAGVGTYHMATDQLDRYRAAVAAEGPGAELETVVRDLKGAGLDVHCSDALKTVPRGYPKDHPRVELLRYKGIVAMKMWPVAPWLGTAAAKKKVVDLFRTARPLTDWLANHVGETLSPETSAPRR
jgi:uncharacterized protein (TIGR02453 family)